MSTHSTIRNTHLTLGIAFTLVWLMYALSSVQMSHPEWFPMQPEVTLLEAPVQVPVTPTAHQVAASLARSVDVAGEVENVSTVGDTLAFRVIRPGTVHEVTFVHGATTALVETQVGGFMNMLNRLHHYAGFWRGWLPLDLWGMLVALASLGLIALGVSGIYLWFRTHGERVVGGAILAMGIAIGAVLIILLRTTA